MRYLNPLGSPERLQEFRCHSTAGRALSWVLLAPPQGPLALPYGGYPINKYGSLCYASDFNTGPFRNFRLIFGVVIKADFHVRKWQKLWMVWCLGPDALTARQQGPSGPRSAAASGWCDLRVTCTPRYAYVSSGGMYKPVATGPLIEGTLRASFLRKGRPNIRRCIVVACKTRLVFPSGQASCMSTTAWGSN